ncbi:hypothetical protein PV328_005789 [Microctonus aethiopoides]|uniref:7tm 6 domain containing protein n=1 Tax=Microctonus aethiopoides TaxID=144406 RepID=A0AA39FMQ4_9HYME|nr:hypothetical protein PV328_005789 [Microctonus aethiopoides]
MNTSKVYYWMILIIILFSLSSSQRVEFHELFGALEKIGINGEKQKSYIIMCNVASSGITLCRFLENRASNILPYKIYLPYNYTKPFLYRFTVLLQSSTLFIAGNVAAGFDTLFFGVMLQIISKINILKHRFQVTVMTLVEIHDKKSCYIKDYNKIEDTFLTIWIKSHKAIISLYAHIEFAFSKVIFAQYSFSALSLCITVYLISQMEIFTTEFIGNFAYLIAATCEIFVFCIAANQVTFEVRNVTSHPSVIMN